jgi:TIR domain
MTDAEVQYVLPGKVERFLALLAKRYAGTSDDRLAALILAAKFSVDTGTFYDNWNGGQYGHDVVLEVPSAVFETILDNKDAVEGRIRDDLGRCHSIPDESIQAVRIELSDDADLAEWRPGSARAEEGVVLRPPADAAALSRLWEPSYFRLFLSHKAEYKEGAGELKRELKTLGLSCFVAHDDIQPTREWQIEIERALHSMEALVALMTSGFSNSNWTDQEVGMAMGRGVPVVSVDLGQTPYGFIGKYQAVKGAGKTSEALASELVRLLVANPRTKRKVVDAMLLRFENAWSYDHAKSLFRFLEAIENPPEDFMERIERAFRENDQVSDSYVVQNGMPRLRHRLGTTS